MTESVLDISGVSAGYGDIIVVRDVSFSVTRGTLYLLLGRNGAGKTTLLHAIAGLVPVKHGYVSILGQRVDQTGTDRRIRKGLALVQAEKRIFRRLTVEQNLRLGWYGRRREQGYGLALERAYSRFPVLKDRRRTTAGSLSGGQQQMLAIAQALMPDPPLAMFDEPTAGLSPAIAHQVLQSIGELKAEGRTIVLVEQAVMAAMPFADHVGVLAQGGLAMSAPAAEVRDISRIQDLYLGSRASGM